jgi:hypothetical protein
MSGEAKKCYIRLIITHVASALPAKYIFPIWDKEFYLAYKEQRVDKLR